MFLLSASLNIHEAGSEIKGTIFKTQEHRMVKFIAPARKKWSTYSFAQRVLTQDYMSRIAKPWLSVNTRVCGREDYSVFVPPGHSAAVLN